MKSIGIRDFSQKNINEKIHITSLIPDLPTKKETRLDVLALDTFRFGEFKGLIQNITLVPTSCVNRKAVINY